MMTLMSRYVLLHMRALSCFVLLFALLWSPPTQAVGLYLKFGPASIGTGGSNPLGIPPSAQDLELQFVTDRGFEGSLGVPGLLFGYRVAQKWGGYVSGGGGGLVNVQGGGLGAYTAFGMDLGTKHAVFNMEYKQAIGVMGGHLGFPYSVRIGAGIWF